MSPELEKLAVETEAALRTLGDLPMEFTLKAAFRQVWNEAIEAASAVCKREEDGPDRTITDPAVAWLSACVVCGLEIDALNEVD